MNDGHLILQIGNFDGPRGDIYNALVEVRKFPTSFLDQNNSIVIVLQNIKRFTDNFLNHLNSINLATKKFYLEIGEDILKEAQLETKLEKQAKFNESFIKSLKNIIKIEKDEESQLVSLIKIIDRMRNLSLELEGLLKDEYEVVRTLAIHLEKKGSNLRTYSASLEKDFNEILRQMNKFSESLRYLFNEDALVKDKYELLRTQLANAGFGAPKQIK